MMNCNRSNVGRAGELRTYLWNSVIFNHDDQILDLNVYQPKTNIDDTMPQTRDKTHWEADIFLGLAAHIILNPHQMTLTHNDTDEATYIFPDLQLIQKSGVSTKLNGVLKGLIGKVRSLLPGTTSHHWRYGSTSDMQAHPDLHFFAMIVRGAWAFLGDCTGIAYMQRRPDSIKASKALGNHRNLLNKVPAPSVDELMDEFGLVSDREKMLFQKFVDALFRGLPFSSQEGDQLYAVKQVLAATVIELLPRVAADLKAASGDQGHRDALEVKVRAVLSDYHFEWKDLLAWSKVVRVLVFRVCSMHKSFVIDDTQMTRNCLSLSDDSCVII